MTAENQSAGNKARPNATSSTTNTKQTEPEANLSLRSYRQANDSLSQGTANERLCRNNMACQTLVILVSNVTAVSGVFAVYYVHTTKHQTSGFNIVNAYTIPILMFRNIATCLDGLGFESRHRHETFLFSQQELNLPGRELDHSLLYSAEIKNDCSYTSTPMPRGKFNLKHKNYSQYTAL